MEDDFNLSAYLRDNDFTEDFLKGPRYDVPGERLAILCYALDLMY